MKTFLISGIPGTGKTSVTKKLNEKYGYPFLSLGEVVVKNKLHCGEDPSRDTKIVDTEKFNAFFRTFFLKQKEDIILEGHYADLIEHPSVNIAIILRAHPNVIETRLKPRGYSKNKIMENIQAELVGDSTSFMLEKTELVKKEHVFEIDTTNLTIEEIADKIHLIIKHPEKYPEDVAGKLSWLSDNSVHIEKYL
ncbi:adenylate kinase family protein [Candidatus Lokiarchaeum ossiferum]|uniref:adenylate kinase family protein n=1 Tax=Candidatus Lokiarchaeum ossiferum TaxID=2951803 RepID=UPI00352D8004